MSTRNDYWAYLRPRNSDLKHYGVKGMKWGQRHDYVPTGRYRYLHRQKATNNRSSRSSSGKYATPAQRRIMNRIKIAKGAMIVGGTAMMAVGGYKWAKMLRTPTGQRLISNGKRQAMTRFNQYSTYARNTRRLASNTRRAITAPIRNNPVGRIASRSLSAPKRVLSGSRAGRIALKTYGAVTLASDANSVYQWSKQVKKKGKVTKKDVGNLAKDLINPLPDNVPLLNKNARAARKTKKKSK